MSISSLQLLIKCRCWWWYEAAGSQVGATWHSTVEISPWPPESWLRSPWWHVLVIVMVMVCTDHHTGNNNISCPISPSHLPHRTFRLNLSLRSQAGASQGLLSYCGHFLVLVTRRRTEPPRACQLEPSVFTLHTSGTAVLRSVSHPSTLVYPYDGGVIF